MLLYTARQLRTRSPRSDKLRPNIPVTCSDNTIKTRARTHGFVTRLSAVIDCINNLHPNKEIQVSLSGSDINILTTLSLEEASAVAEKQYCVFTCCKPEDEYKWTATKTGSINGGVQFYIATRPITYFNVEPVSLKQALNQLHQTNQITITRNT